jgi:dipeptidyl aminopeptidase/acylaminoacyl peptidase
MRTALWAIDSTGNRRTRRLTRSEPGESIGRFANDGSILFASKRVDPEMGEDDKGEKERSGLWLLPAEGGEPELIVNPVGGVDDAVAARRADAIVVAAEVFPGTSSLDEDVDRHEARKKAGVSAQLFEDYPIRLWDHYLGPRERHLLALTLGDRAPRDLTPDAHHALPDMGFDLSPDGATIVTAWQRFDDLELIHTDLVAIDRVAGERRTLASDDGYWLDPAISPDGRWAVAVRWARSTPESPGDQTLRLIDLAAPADGDDGVVGRDLLPGFDLGPQHPVWTLDGSAVLFTADRDGRTAVFRVDVQGGEPTLLAADGAYADLSPTAEALYALRSNPDSPPVIVRLDLQAANQSGEIMRSLPELDDLELPGVVERLEATASDGQRVPAWLVRPADASADKPAPLVVWVHGGPIASWSGWFWRWNPHLLAARGYAVLLPDPALSTGYGLDYLRRGWGRWGEAPFTDVIAAADAALERPDLDTGRTALMGGSFGGYMANWVATRTDRFRAIVTHASLWELRGFHGTTDLGPAWEEEFGDPYRDPERYEAANPAPGVDRIRTPMLVIHGELDHRVPISEALRLWTDLRRHGVESRFLYFPDENHWILKPQNARVWYETVLAFLDEHVLDREFVRPALL